MNVFSKGNHTIRGATLSPSFLYWFELLVKSLKTVSCYARGCSSNDIHEIMKVINVV